ncbi:MAG: polysaccharide pyruvyl transferase family protein [Chloroflexota bacterium]
MRILIDSDNSDCHNMGDVAMLQMAVARLSAQWPDATIEVITKVPASLAIHCPSVIPVDYWSRYSWLADDYLLGRLHTLLPDPTSHQLGELKRTLERHVPALVASTIRLRSQLAGHEIGDPRAFLDTLSEADLLVVCGLGGLTDFFQPLAYLVLNTLEIAMRCSKPTAMFSQGIGPIEHHALLSRVKAVLPKVDLIALRENRSGLPLLKSMGVAPDRIVVTGDDAVELAYEARPNTFGKGMGINLRVAASSGVDHSFVAKVRGPLHQFAKTHNAPLLPVPISIFNPLYDPQTIRELMMGYDDTSDGGAHLNTPLKIIEQVGQCRIVVTGAYHAAVFALAQGVPVVCLAKTAYYMDKFMGLADLFGTGCETVMLQDVNLSEKLTAAMERAWATADEVRPVLLAASVRQIELGRNAYRQLHDQVTPVIPVRVLA